MIIINDDRDHQNIDSVPDEFGELYRVWNSYHLLGTFYQNLEDKWVAQPCNRDERPCCGRVHPVTPAKYSCVLPVVLNAASAFSSPVVDARSDLAINPPQLGYKFYGSMPLQDKNLD